MAKRCSLMFSMFRLRPREQTVSAGQVCQTRHRKKCWYIKLNLSYWESVSFFIRDPVIKSPSQFVRQQNYGLNLTPYGVYQKETG